jgi:hypothetical protein
VKKVKKKENDSDSSLDTSDDVSLLLRMDLRDSLEGEVGFVARDSTWQRTCVDLDPLQVVRVYFDVKVGNTLPLVLRPGHHSQQNLAPSSSLTSIASAVSVVAATGIKPCKSAVVLSARDPNTAGSWREDQELSVAHRIESGETALALLAEPSRLQTPYDTFNLQSLEVTSRTSMYEVKHQLSLMRGEHVLELSMMRADNHRYALR